MGRSVPLSRLWTLNRYMHRHVYPAFALLGQTIVCVAVVALAPGLLYARFSPLLLFATT